MPTEAIIGAGSELRLGDGASPETFAKIAQVTRVGSVGQTAPEIEATPIDSTAREYIGGLKDGEQVEFDLDWKSGDTQHEALRDAVGNAKNFQLVFPDTDQAEFTMVMLSFMRNETTADGKLSATIMGRITGDITWS